MDNPEPCNELSKQQLLVQVNFLRSMAHDLQQQLDEANDTNRRNTEQFDRLYRLVESSQAEQKRLLSIIESLQSQLI